MDEVGGAGRRSRQVLELAKGAGRESGGGRARTRRGSRDGEW